METKHLTYFKVENFKRFDSLEVNDIGQFNLIVGDNNVGKTSLLEALLFDDENYDDYLRNMWFALYYRSLPIYKENNINYVSFLLSKITNDRSFKLNFSYDDRQINHLDVSSKIKSELSKEELDNIGNQIVLHALDQHLVRFDLNGRMDVKFIFDYESAVGEKYVPYIPFTSRYDSDLIIFFSRVSISTQKLENIKDQLRYFVPNLISIEISNAIILQESFLVLRESTNDFAKPLVEYGEGTVKFLRYLLEIEMCENKRLMIDEIDTGIHYSRMKEFLKKVLQSAKNKNVQIFATTHSKECLEYYTKALEELGFQDDARIIKLADTKIGIRAYTSRFIEFENSLDAEAEIR